MIDCFSLTTQTRTTWLHIIQWGRTNAIYSSYKERNSAEEISYGRSTYLYVRPDPGIFCSDLYVFLREEKAPNNVTQSTSIGRLYSDVPIKQVHVPPGNGGGIDFESRQI